MVYIKINKMLRICIIIKWYIVDNGPMYNFTQFSPHYRVLNVKFKSQKDSIVKPMS